MKTGKSSLSTLQLVLLLSTAWASLPARAQVPPTTFNVNTFADLVDNNTADGQCRTDANNCSLRAAVMQANHITATSTIINLPAGTYLLTRPPGTGADEVDGDLDILVPAISGQNVTISGAGAASTIIDANHLDRALEIAPGGTASIANLTIRNGNADSGGGIRVGSAALTIRDCVIEGNHAQNDGGGIYEIGGALTIVRSTIRANLAGFDGGGMYLSGQVLVRESTVYANGANEGGGMRNSQQLLMVNSTISQNYANTDGGGIYNADTTFLYNSSVIDNDADHDRDENGGVGGGIYAESGRTVGLVNTLVLDNTIGNAPIYDDCRGPLTAYGLSLFSDVSGCAPSGAWDAVPHGTMGALQNNGGATLTHAPHADSLAIDSTNDALGCVDETGALLTTDQRGAVRAGAGVRCDVGAVEVGAVVDLIFRNGFQ